MNTEGRRESSNIEDKRHPSKEKAAKDRMNFRKNFTTVEDQWDKVASRHNEREDSKERAYYFPDSDGIGDIESERYWDARYSEHEKPDTTERQDNIKPNPRIARRRSLEGKDLGEYKMR